MEKTPHSLRKHILLWGETNVGKSSLLNALCGQDLALVSEQPGTTTDPVSKAYELLPFGPVVWVDTAGYSDPSPLGKQRMQRTLKELDKADFILWVKDASASEGQTIPPPKEIPVLTVFTKSDLLSALELRNMKEKNPEAVFVSVMQKDDILQLRTSIAGKLSQTLQADPLMLADKLQTGDHLLLVVPIDTEAPKGRIIAPQTALLREALDHGIICTVCRPEELEFLLKSQPAFAWIVTDSQAFKNVHTAIANAYTSENQPRLSSFSILMSRQKGDLQTLYSGAMCMKDLKDDAHILIAEACSHTRSHEDIARVKLPNLLHKVCQKNFRFAYCNGKDFPEDLSTYDLVIHCGGCMITRKNMLSRIHKAQETPITNFGIALAYLNGILEDATQGL